MAKRRQTPLAHPGEILNEEFLRPLNLTPSALALALRVPSNRIYAIIEGERGITPDTALRLGRYFGMSAEFWLNLQTHYDLELTRERFGEDIQEQVVPRPPAS